MLCMINRNLHTFTSVHMIDFSCVLHAVVKAELAVTTMYSGSTIAKLQRAAVRGRIREQCGGKCRVFFSVTPAAPWYHHSQSAKALCTNSCPLLNDRHRPTFKPKKDVLSQTAMLRVTERTWVYYPCFIFFTLPDLGLGTRGCEYV